MRNGATGRRRAAGFLAALALALTGIGCSPAATESEGSASRTDAATGRTTDTTGSAATASGATTGGTETAAATDAATSAAAQSTGTTAGKTTGKPAGTSTTEAAQEANCVTDIGIWYSTWYAKKAETSTDNKINTWTAWKIPFVPLMPDGTYGTYDSLDREVTLFHLKKMSEAQIDFIIMDQTNNIDVDDGYINERSLSVARVIKEYNDNAANRPVRYCSAIGGIQWSQDASTIETEARMLWTRYVEQGFGGEKYHYQIDGKPVLVVYGDGAEEKWKNYTGSKTYGSKFAIRWADNQSQAGYWGWAYDGGTKLHWETSVVMPGWNNMKGHTPVNRRNGLTYEESWNVLLKAAAKPRIVVINSFNEYAERTAVFPADSSTAVPVSDRWLNGEYEVDNTMYWEMTVGFIKSFKSMDKPLIKPYSD